MSFNLLTKILSEPTAPYREMHVQKTIKHALEKNSVPYFSDPIGNIIIGARNSDEYHQKVRLQSSEPVRVYIAHTDHPGFHGVCWVGPKRLKAKWLGGSPTRHLRGASVWLASKEGWQPSGEMTKAQLDPTGRFIASAEISFSSGAMKEKFPDATALFGAFGFRAPVWSKGDLLYTKAADDLVGAYSITELAIQLSKTPEGLSHFLGVLTRAEEVGFIGAIAHFELGWLQEARRSVVCVSLEASRALPGAEIGKGPVVRLGDRATVFDARALQVLTKVAATKLAGKHQRRLMDGGTCEATVATAYGFPAIGISIPLGNYHNQSFEGAPGSRGPLGPAPEFVHRNDVRGMVALCKYLMKDGLPWESPWSERLGAFKKSRTEASELLSLSS